MKLTYENVKALEDRRAQQRQQTASRLYDLGVQSLVKSLRTSVPEMTAEYEQWADTVSAIDQKKWQSSEQMQGYLAKAKHLSSKVNGAIVAAQTLGADAEYIEGLRKANSSLQKQIDALNGLKDVFGQFENEAAYNEKLQEEAAAKDFQDKVANMDIDAERKELAALQKEINQLQYFADNGGTDGVKRKADYYNVVPEHFTPEKAQQQLLRQQLVDSGIIKEPKAYTAEEAAAAAASLREQLAERQQTLNLVEKRREEQGYIDALKKNSDYDDVVKGVTADKLVNQLIELDYQMDTDTNVTEHTGVMGWIEGFTADYDSVQHGFDIDVVIDLLNHATNDEAKAFYYLAETKDLFTAKTEYFDKISNTLRERKGAKKAQEIVNKDDWGEFWSATGLAIQSGFENFTSGVAKWFGDDTTSAAQYAAQYYRGEHEQWSAMGIYFDLLQTGANMAPSIALSVATKGIAGAAGMSANAAGALGSAVGSISMGLSSAGTARQAAIDEGYSEQQATFYGILTGLSEAGLQYLMGGISKLGGTGKVVSKITQNIPHWFLRGAADLGLSMLSEGTEEYLQDVLTPVFKKIALGEEFDKSFWETITSSEAWYSFALGALSAGFTDGVLERPFSNAYKQSKKIASPNNADSLKLAYSDEFIQYAKMELTPGSDGYALAEGLENGTYRITESNLNELNAYVTVAQAESEIWMYNSMLDDMVENGGITKEQRDALSEKMTANTTERTAAAQVVIDRGIIAMSRQFEADDYSASGGFVGADSGMSYDSAAAGALAQVSTEGIQNAFGYYYGTDTDIPPSVVGISRDSDVYKGLEAAGLTNDDGTIKGIAFVDERSRRKGEVGQGLAGEGKQLTVNEITVNMSDAERAQILRNKTITPVAVSDEHSEHFDYADLKAKIKSKVEKTLLKKFQELGFLKKYSAPTLGDITFSFTAGGVRKSLNSQETLYGGDKADFTKAVVHLQELLDNSVLIETHTDKATGTERENIRLKQVYVLLSAMQDGESIIPVQFEIKQYVDDNNRLYLAVALTKIETGVMGYTASDNQIRTSLLPVSTISIPELVAKINPADRNFLKYIPDEFLNSEQLDAKRRALVEDTRKYGTAAQPARDMRSHEARPLTENEKKRLGWICQRLNVDIDFDYQGVGDGVYLPAENGRRARISLSAAPLEPYKFVFKHELAHHLQTAKGYEQTRKALLGSPVFTDWLQQKYGGGIVQARMAVIERYRQQGVTLDLTESTDELVADFFADCAFDGLDGEIDNQFLDRLAADEPNLFKRLWNAIKDLVEQLRGMFYFKDMSEVERRFETLARQVQAGQTENTAKNGGARYSISNDDTFAKYCETIDKIADSDDVSHKGQYIEVSQQTPSIIVEKAGAKNLPMAILFDTAYLETRHDGHLAGNYHNLGSNMKLLPELLEIPEYIIKLPNGRLNVIVDLAVNKTSQVLVSIELEQAKQVNGKFNKYNLIITAFGAKSGYLSNLLNNPKNEVLYNKKTESQGTDQLHKGLDGINDSVSNNSVPQKAAAVNNHSMQGNEKYSIPSDEGDAAEDRQSAAQQTAADIVDAFNKGELDSEAALGRMADLFGRMKPGKKNNVDVVMPQSVDGQKKVRRLTQSIIETGLLPKSAADTLQGGIVQGDYSYTPEGDKPSLEWAEEYVVSDLSGAARQWENRTSSGATLTKRDIALGERLLQHACENKDDYSILKYTAELSEAATRAGQTVQAFSMLKKLGGVGQLYYVQRTVDSLNRDLEKRYKGKHKKVTIDGELAQQLASSTTKDDCELASDELLQDIANQVPVTLLDKWNAWRYLSMLGNPRTHIRNLTGNAVFGTTVRIKDVIATAMEATAEKAGLIDASQRTKTLKVNKAYREFAESDWQEYGSNVDDGGRYNPSDVIRDKQRIFKNKVLEGARKANFAALEKGDEVFLKGHYIRALSGYLQARGIDLDTITEKQLDDARAYATKEAQKATFHDANAVASALARFSRRVSDKDASMLVRSGAALVEGILPFKKTPINILARGIEYSPLGLIKQLTYGVYQLKNGNINATQFIDGLASGTTGTGLAVLGYFLASCGVAIGGLGWTDEDDEYDELNGHQAYSLEFGDVSYTVDWMAPASLPFFIGVELFGQISENEGLTFESVIDAFKGVFEPIFEMSMLSGINDVLKTARTEDNAITAAVAQAIWSYFTQAVPTLSGQIARTVDGTRRTTYAEKDNGIPDGIEKKWQKLLAKVPLASFLSPAYIDAYGQTEKTDNVFMRLFANMLSPGYVSTVYEDDVTAELKRLHGATGKNVYSTAISDTYYVGGESHQMTVAEYELVAAQAGQFEKMAVSELVRSDAYKSATDEQKVAAIQKIVGYSDELACDNVLGVKSIEDGDHKYMHLALDAGLSIDEVMTEYIATKGLTSKEDYVAAINGCDMSDKWKKMYIQIYGIKHKSNWDFERKKVAITATVKLYLGK